MVSNGGTVFPSIRDGGFFLQKLKVEGLLGNAPSLSIVTCQQNVEREACVSYRATARVS